MRKSTIRKRGFSNPFEKQVYDTLCVEFNDEKAKVLHNCYFLWASGKPSESDLVMITRRGLFVVECKDYSGRITGTDSDGDFIWRKTIIRKDGTEREYKFLNPLYQNFLHIQCIKENIDSTDIPIYSLVVFADRCDISKVRFSRPNTAVTSFNRMCAQIVLMSANSHCMLSNDEIQELCVNVRSVAGTPQEYKEMLIAGINEKKQVWKNAVFVRFTDRHTGLSVWSVLWIFHRPLIMTDISPSAMTTRNSSMIPSGRSGTTRRSMRF